MECDEIGQFHQLLSSNFDLLNESGFNKPITNVKLCDKDLIIKSITLHSVLLSSSAALSQFRDGIYKVKGHQTMLEKYPILLEPFIVIKKWL